MTAETQKAFAARIGRDPSWVTRAKQAGRLVLSSAGLVEVEASLERIQATRGARYDVEDRWDAHRADNGTPPSGAANGPGETAQPESRDDDGISVDEIGRRTRLAKMRSEEAAARQRELELDELEGRILRRDAVDQSLADAVALILSHIENLPDRVAPQLVDVSDMERVRARLKDELEGVCLAVSRELGSAADREG